MAQDAMQHVSFWKPQQKPVTMSKWVKVLNPNRGRPGIRRGLVRELEIAIDAGPKAIIQFVFENSTPIPFSGCWIWNHGTAGHPDRMYALMVDPRKPINRANPPRVIISRLVCEARHGPMAAHLDARHTCDVACCVNPDHVIPGTRQDNMDDMVARGRSAGAEGSNNSHATLSEDIARAIRAAQGTPIEVAKLFDTNPKIVRRIRNGETWRHL